MNVNDEGVVSEVTKESREIPPELLEAQRIQIDSEYGMKVRHRRELENLAATATPEEQLAMAVKMDFSILITAIWQQYSEKAEKIDKIGGLFNE